jgi:hypothetical protein
MEINKRLFLIALSQIKAHKDIVVLRDSPVEGCLDILYTPKTSDTVSQCVNKMTICVSGNSTDLFDDVPAEKLGDILPIHLNRAKGILKDATSCIINNGNINGIRVQVMKNDMTYSIVNFITNYYEYLSGQMKDQKLAPSVPMRQVDYSYMVTECSKFVAKNVTRELMTGVCFDFDRAEDNYVNIIATDGRKLCRMKHCLNGAKKGNGEFVILPLYLHVPDSFFTTAEIKLAGKINQLLIHTEDYNFEGLFEGIDIKYPNYLKVIPEINESTQWFTLCAASLRMTIDSVKSLMDKKNSIYLNAENPESLSITVGDGTTTLEVEGTASRPMHVSFLWEHLGPCLFDGIALTKFYLNGSDYAVQTHPSKAVKGITLNVIKLFMPTKIEGDHTGEDEFRIPKS